MAGRVKKLGSRRMKREAKTLSLMMELYCTRMGHKPDCAECGELLVFALERLRRCRYAQKKPACSNCPSPCYPLIQREEMKKIMRFAGPRMLLRHPLLALLHMKDVIISRKKGRK